MKDIFSPEIRLSATELMNVCCSSVKQDVYPGVTDDQCAGCEGGDSLWTSALFPIHSLISYISYRLKDEDLTTCLLHIYR